MAAIKIQDVTTSKVLLTPSETFTIQFKPFQDVLLIVDDVGAGYYTIDGPSVAVVEPGTYELDGAGTMPAGDGRYTFMEYGDYDVGQINEVYAMVNGQKVVATYNATTGLYTVTTNAPAASSWSQPDHVYPVTLHASDVAGNTASMTSADPTYGSQLKIRVLEKTKPTAAITSPTQNAVLGSGSQDIVMELLDSGGSGLNMSSVEFKLNGVKITTGLTWTDGTGGKKVATYKATNLSDGSNVVSLVVTDNDGNVATTATRTFIVSTAAPTLSVNTPIDNLLTNVGTVTVAGSAAAGSQYVTLAEVTINGTAVTTSAGAFSKEVTLTEGANTITVVARDSLGKTTTVSRVVTLDTKTPVISDVVAQAVTVDSGGTIRITFKVTDPS